MSDAQLPPASVIVPTRDRPQLLGRCLEAIAGLDYPADRLEVVVVDDASEAPLDPVVAPFRPGLRMQVIAAGGRGPAAARNAGIAAATGELIAFTDDDCAPDTEWLAVLASVVAGRERLAGGRTVNGLTDNAYSAASQAINDAVYAHYNADAGRAAFFASNNVAGPAAVFERLGGFDERFSLAAGEDRDLCSRWLEQGGELVFAPGAVVRHFHELSARRFWHQHYGYGRGTRLQRELEAERGGDGIELAPATTSGILSLAARTAIRERRPSRLVLLGLWQLANLVGFARQSVTRKRRG